MHEFCAVESETREKTKTLRRENFTDDNTKHHPRLVATHPWVDSTHPASGHYSPLGGCYSPCVESLLTPWVGATHPASGRYSPARGLGGVEEHLVILLVQAELDERPAAE